MKNILMISALLFSQAATSVTLSVQANGDNVRATVANPDPYCGVELHWGDGSVKKLRIKQGQEQVIEHQYKGPGEFSLEAKPKYISAGLKSASECPSGAAAVVKVVDKKAEEQAKQAKAAMEAQAKQAQAAIDAQAARLAELEAKLKAAEAAAAKTPEQKAEEARIAAEAKAYAEAKVAAEAKAKAEAKAAAEARAAAEAEAAAAARAEEEKRALAEAKAREEQRAAAAAEAKQRRAEAEKKRLQALARLKVKDVGLGKGPVPCKPREETYVDILQKPVRLQYECSFGPSRDRVEVIFAGDRETVVRVRRMQYLLPSDPKPDEVLEAAVRYYGPPTARDNGNYFAMYGTPMNYRYNGKQLVLSKNENGMGLSIDGKLCGDGRWGTEKCGNLGTMVVVYDLVNHSALTASYADGKARLATKNKSKVNSLKF